MRLEDHHLEEVSRRGYCLIEGFLPPGELRAAQEALWLHFPKPEDFFLDPSRHPDYCGDQFGGVEEFPYRAWALNRLAFHPDLVDAAERYLGTTDLHLYKVELWAKYGGAANYEQPLHRDFGSHSLVVPRLDRRYQQLTTFIYLSDVTAEDGPTRIVPYESGKDVPFTPLYLEFGALWDREVPAVGPAGSLLSIGPTSCTGAPTSPASGRPASPCLPTIRSGERHGAGRWRGRSNPRNGGPSSCHSARFGSGISSDFRGRVTLTGTTRRCTTLPCGIPAWTWNRTEATA